MKKAHLATSKGEYQHLLRDDFQSYITQLRETVSNINAEFDTATMNWISSYPRGVSCSRGCSICCDMYVGAFSSEALVIANSISDEQYQKVLEHTNKVIDYAREYAEQNFAIFISGYRLAVGFCPLLDSDGACSIYSIRPGSCRYTYSNMLPKYCQAGYWRTVTILERDEYLAKIDPKTNAGGYTPHLAPIKQIYDKVYDEHLRSLKPYSSVILVGNMHYLIYLSRKPEYLELLSSAKNWKEMKTGLSDLGFFIKHILTEKHY